ncbi:hypothetical protein ETD86_37060 [Nonomuraea turkmeniaca]|uniref:Uncharacterized protein n=1 Tax=Nonomuraea turkmeniaca TaxID=103838 RepID=A0A5S4F4I3_9ACTN|nr:hypothetical protein [Nonomuraea turkmeniaca]TMR11056.1 hypothetical protein ETD86_37060 [Nonomuraea turkmeniaca]
MSLASLDPGNAATGWAVVGGGLILLLFAGLSWAWRRLRRISDPPNTAERILREALDEEASRDRAHLERIDLKRMESEWRKWQERDR